ncbi:hypothetical protein SAMN02745823_01912 [Sporobacter termitidis DSM 10068]|uniref:Uncharacterized protein n=1 Tax=Sporobacter termitidis DSM 10068 TaxID=1123282 RepID=A0A1M5XP80_9FIRM|nr:DUF6143 family protein [Sporobacter termitidis]SHI01539.1 hypothetical protein SAMN02745823_01912 [Sporobacter termitidis DSM 10068]
MKNDECCGKCNKTIETTIGPKTICVPIELYQSEIGEYFIGYADGLTFGNGTTAWAMLYNPLDSDVNLHVDTWTVTGVSGASNPMEAPGGYTAQFWFNAKTAGAWKESPRVTPANTAYWPLPAPQVKLLQASNSTTEPSGGVMGFARRGAPNETISGEEGGKLIIPPGGNLMVLLSNPDSPSSAAAGSVGFGWWEERI